MKARTNLKAEPVYTLNQKRQPHFSRTGSRRTADRTGICGSFRSSASPVVQRVVYASMNLMWAAVANNFDVNHINADSVLKSIYDDASAELANCNFTLRANTSPQITHTPTAAQDFRIDWDTAGNCGLDADFHVGAIIHELAHAACSAQYRRNGINAAEMVYANLNLPVAVGVVNMQTGMTPNQLTSYQNQITTLDDNWGDLETEAAADLQATTLSQAQHAHIQGRINYARATLFLHNDPVLADVMYYLRAKGLETSKTYIFARRMLKEANDRRRQGFWSTATQEVRRVDRNAWALNFSVW